MSEPAVVSNRFDALKHLLRGFIYSYPRCRDQTSEDVSRAYCVKSDPKDKTRPIIIRFIARKLRDQVLRAKASLKSKSGPRIFISEQLTKTSSNLFDKARQLVKDKKIHSVWTTN